jgi:hypothetical protein
MPPVPKVELYAAIRRDARAGMSARAIERKYRVGRRTIIKALASAWPESRKKPPRRASKLDPFKPAIDEMLRADLDAPRKQRHTITRIYRRLIEEHQMRDVSYPVVRAYVAERRPQIRAETGRGLAEVFVQQSHRPGAEAEVDFGEVAVRLAGEQVNCFLFCLRLSFSGKAVHRSVDRTTGASSQTSVTIARGCVPDAITRTEPPWMSTRRFPGETWQAWWSPRSGRCGRRTIPCCRGSWWTRQASRSSPSATSCGTCWPAATARPRAGPMPMTCCDGFGSSQRLTSGGTGRSAPRCAILCCGCARVTIRLGTGGGQAPRHRDR